MDNTPYEREFDYQAYMRENAPDPSATNARTMIAAVIPQVGCIDTLPVLLPLNDRFDAFDAVCILANLNSFCFDYVARQKVQGTHIIRRNDRP